EGLGWKESYFRGRAPFLHGDIPVLLAAALEAAPTTVLTNGTCIDAIMADELAALFASARYSLSIRVSLDDTDPVRNDRVRGESAFAKAVEAIRLLHDRGLLPIGTATEVTTAEPPDARRTY